MFNKSKYTKWYYELIEKSITKQRKKNKNEYFELHHIIPTSLGGNNDKENKVLLTSKEHFICHLLLTKMTEANEKHKMIWALHRMSFSKVGLRNLNSYQYELARKIFIKQQKLPKSQAHKDNISKSLKGIPFSEERKKKMTGERGWKHKEETKRKMSEQRKGKIHVYNKETLEEKLIHETDFILYDKEIWLKGRCFTPYIGKKHSQDQKKKWSEERKGSKQPAISKAKTGMVQAIDLNGIFHYVTKEEFSKRNDLYGVRNNKVKHLIKRN